MRIQNQTVVSLRYIMKNAAGEILEDNMKEIQFNICTAQAQFFLRWNHLC